MCQLRRLYHHVGEHSPRQRFSPVASSKVHEGQTTNEAFVPSQLLYLIWTHENHLAGFEEQDAQELLMALFNIIHSQHSTDDGKVSIFFFFFFLDRRIALAHDEKTCSCIIDRFFKGALQSEITCSQCG